MASANRRASSRFRLRSFAPDQVRIGRIRNAAGDGGVQSASNAEKAFGCAFAGEELAVARIDVAGQQMRAVARRCAP